MRWIPERLPYSYRLLFAFGIPLLIWFLVSIGSFYSLRHTVDSSNRVVEIQDTISLARDYRALVAELGDLERAYIVTPSRDTLVERRELMQQGNLLFERLVELSRGQTAQLERLERAGDALQEWYYDISEKRIESYSGTSDGSANSYRPAGKAPDGAASLVADFQKSMASFIETEREILANYQQEIRKTASMINWMVWAGLIIGILLMVVIMLLVARRLSRSVRGIDRASDELAKGNWSVRVEGIGQNDRLADRFNFLVDLIERRNKEAALLAELGEALHSCTSIAEALDVFGQFSKSLFPDQPGTLFMVDANGEDVSAVSHWRGAEKYSEEHLTMHDCWALRLNRTQVNKPEGNLRCAHLRENHQSSLCIPLPAFGEVIGVLFLVQKNNPELAQRAEQERQRQFSDTVAEQVALAFANVKLREKLKSQAVHDPLTQLYNRRQLDDTLQREIYRAKRHNHPLAVLAFDIDHFKKYNDEHGHDGGDAVLKCLSDVLRDFFRPEDSVFRSGGEEFITLLPGTSVSDAVSRAEALRTEIASTKVTYNGTILPAVTVSIGVASYPESATDPSRLLTAADRALYRAKSAGRNRVAGPEQAIE